MHRKHMINYRATDKEKDNLLKLQVYQNVSISSILRMAVNTSLDIYEDDNIRKLMKLTNISHPIILFKKLVIKELLNYEQDE